MKRSAGFTLIELLLVLAIIGVISAIAVPALLGQRDRAKMRAVQDQTVSIIGDLSSVVNELNDPPSERKTGYPTTLYAVTAAGNQAKAQDVINIVLARTNFATAKNSYSGAGGVFTSAVTPSGGAGLFGQVYVDATTANSIEEPQITVTGVFRDPDGNIQYCQKSVGLN
jgi:prepilin-type N-terminal cleavage/methylation domain-containing protein